MSKPGHLPWVSPYTTPTSTTLNDTLTEEKNFVMIPKLFWSKFSQSYVNITAYELVDSYAKDNINLALGDTLRVYANPVDYTSFPSAMSNLTSWLNEITTYTSIPTKLETTAGTWPIANYDPYTTSHTQIISNMTPGGSNTYWDDHTLATGEGVRVRSSIINNLNSKNNAIKELLRTAGFDEASGILASNPTNWTGTNAAVVEILYNLSKKKHSENKHDEKDLSNLYQTYQYAK
jgi:hypothetical protein